MSDLINTVRRTIDRYALLPHDRAVVVGVSGGPDSLCLLHALRALAPEYSVSLHVAHLNHQLREADSDQDAVFVAQLADEWGLPRTIAARDVAAYARWKHLAIEEAARQMRYGFLAEVARQIGSDTIAVAHHADDQAESVLMHIIRGSGLAGLRGMRPKSRLGDMRLPEQPALHSILSTLYLIRPLLDVTRADIEAYRAANDLHPRFDLSNLDQTYFRNWLRHTVLPLLAQHNPGVRDVLCRTAQVTDADYEFLHSEMELVWPQVASESPSAIEFKLSTWRALPLSLKRATVREAIHRLRRHLRNINFVHVERAVEMAGRGMTGDRATLTDGLALSVSYNSFTIADEHHEPPLPDWPLLEPGTWVTLNIPGRSYLLNSDWALEAVILTQALGYEVNPDPWTAYLDADVCSDTLMLRTRLPGDRIAPQGMGGHRAKLNEIMINERVPAHVRDRLPNLVCGVRILWVCGLRVDESARVTPATRRILRLRFMRLGG